MKQFFKGALLVFLLTIGGYCANAAVVLSETHTNVSCYGGSNGTINLSATGTAPFVYIWNDSILLEDRSGIPAGTYTVVVFDALLTSDTLSVTILQPAQIVAAKAITPVSCGGGNDGAIDLTISGGTPGYSVLWQDAATIEDRTNLTAFNYHFTVTDGNGCQMNDSANVTQPMGMVPSIAVTDANCNANNGNIDLTVQYGYPPYSYVWGDGPTTEDRNSLNIGTYTVTVTDNIACTVSMTATVNQANTPMNINHTQVNAACFASATGSINITSVVGAPGPFTYNWNNAATTQNISALAAGSYTVTVTSANSCTATKIIVITEPTQLTVNTTAIQPTCFGDNNGAITTAVSGGTTGYNYNWGSGFTTQNRFGLADGTYTVTVTDNRGCTASSSKTITSPAQVLVVATPTQLNCMGGSTGAVSTTVTGGTGAYSYWWGAGVTSANRTGLAAGTYNVTVNDANGCSATATTTIAAYVPMTSSSTQVNNNCNGDSIGAIDLTVNNGRAPYIYNWSNSATTQDLANLKADTYTVIVTDNNSCTVTRNVNITQPMFPIYLNATVADATCNGNDGSISISPASGAAPFTYIWNDTVATQNRSGLAAGIYAVTLTDNNGCQATGSYTINEPAGIALMTVANDVTCNGGSTGSISLTVLGGNAPFTYLWNDAANTQNRTNILAGTYSVTVTDNHGCSASATETINQPTALSATATVTNLSCFGAANGAIALNVSGGSGSPTFRWNNNTTAQNRSGLTAGIYSVTITDMSACSVTLSATVTQPAALTLTRTSTNVTCNGGNNGTIALTVNGGTAPYSYVWSDNGIVEDRTNLAAGTYTVTVIDNNMCSATSTATITQPAPLAITATVNNATCNTGGSIVVIVSGGAGGKSYIWSNGATTQSIGNLSPNTYTVTATYANGCSISASYTIIGITPLSITHTKVNNTVCYGDTAGAIDITVNGGSAPYTYQWNNGSTNEDRINLAGGNYRVTVTDTAQCSASASINILQPSSINTHWVKTNVSCLSTNDGAVNLNPTGGSQPYTYQWNNGNTTKDITALTVGVYYVTVTDANGCSVKQTFNIQQPSSIAVAVSQTNVSCYGGNNGAINITASGGTGSYKYQWNNGPPVTSLTNLIASTYVVTVTDTVSTCRLVKFITITQPAALQTLSTKTNVSCNNGNNGSITMAPFGGTAPYQYLWSNTATTATNNNLVAGSYTVTITDTNSCSITGTVAISEPAPLVTTAASSNSCFEFNNGTISLATTGGTVSSHYVYNWSNGDTTQNLSNLNTGTYTVTVNDDANCTTTTTATINRFAELVLTETHNDVSCFGASTGVIQITTQGGAGHYHFDWNNGSTSNLLNNITAGTYTVSVTDGAGCTAQKSITLTEPTPISLTEQHINHACNSNPGQIDVSVAGGTPPYFYRWNDNANSEDRNSLSAGTYQITVSDYNSCSSIMAVEITSPQPLSLATTSATPSCYSYNNGSITSTVSGGALPYSYLWTDGSTNRDLTNITAGTYAILVTDANNCSVTQAIALGQPDAIKATIAVSHVMCNGDTTGKAGLAVTNGTAPYTYLWNNAGTERDQLNIPAGSYAVTVTDAANCSVAFTGIDVNQPAKLDIQSAVTPAGCFANSAYGAIDVTVSGGTAPVTYNWNNSASTQDISNLTAGNYFLVVTDANGCISTKANTVPQTPPINLAAITKDASCAQVNNGTIELTINGGVPEFTFAWSNGANAQNLDNLAAGTYTVTVSDISHCSAEANYTIATSYELTANAATNIESLLRGQTAELTALTNVDNANSYTWSSTEEVKCPSCAITAINPSSTAAYTLVVTDENGCSATDMVTVEVKDIEEIFIPNAFTPNNDANNDVFKIYGDMSTIALLDLKVFNRWGEKVYETGDIEFAWDGTYKGEIVDRGVYTYTLKIVYVNGVANDLYKGSITVLR